MNDDTYNTFYKNDDVDPEYDGCFWKATANADGTWTIANFYNKTIQYSIKYASFGCYSAEQNNAALPRLYKLQQ